MITALMIQPDKHPCITRLCDNEDYLNCAVSIDSDLIHTAAALRIEDGIAVIYSDDCALSIEPPNRRIGNRIITGTFYIVRVKDGKLKTLTDDDITRFTLQYWEPEIYSDDDVFNSWYP